jgi:hypothetical protein
MYKIFERVVAEWFWTRRKAAKGKYPEQTPEEYLAAYYQNKLSATPTPSGQNRLF